MDGTPHLVTPTARLAVTRWPPARVAVAVLAVLFAVALATGGAELLRRRAVGPSSLNESGLGRLSIAPGVEPESRAGLATDALADGPLIPLAGEGALTSAQEAPAAGVPDGALIVRTASLELEAADVTEVLVAARRGISGLGGYVAGSDEVDQGERRWATVVYRVPVEDFDAALDVLRGLADRVVRETTQAQEVTATVLDLDARIANLEASEAALVEIMDRAGRIEDVLAVQLRLEDVRGRIEQLTAQRDGLADRAALATLSVTWLTPIAAVQVAQEGWDLGTEVDTALAQTVAALQDVAGLGVWLALVVLPLLGIPLLGVIVIALLVRRHLTTRGASAGPG